MHIAIVTETHPPEINGVALTVQGIREGLLELGHRASLVRLRRPGEAADEHDTLQVPGLPVPGYPGLRFGLPAAARLRRLWRETRPDAVYVATEGPLGASAVFAARRLGLPVAVGYHTHFDTYLPGYGVGALAPLARAWLRFVHTRADATIVPTRALADTLRQRGFRNVLRLPRGVDTHRFHPARRDPALRTAWGAGEATPVALYVGRLAPEKNLRLAVEAFRAMQAERPDARFVLVGDGPSRAALQREHPDFIFQGVRRGAELARHFASGDLFLFPSTSETFGNVVLEAMAGGVAVIAFDDGAAHEHIRDGFNGRRLALGDETGFVRAATMLSQEPALRERLAAMARQSVLTLDPSAVSTRLVQLMGGLCRPDAGPVAQGLELRP